MNDDMKLDRELVWDGAHVSELAITALADGQEAILEFEVLQHVEACDWCGGRLGRVALLSAAVGDGLAEARPLAATERAQRAPAPWRALALGIAVAVLAAMPTLPHLVAELMGAMSYGKAFTAHGVPVLVRSGMALANSESAARALSLATIASSALLVMMGWAIARSRTQGSSERSTS